MPEFEGPLDVTSRCPDGTGHMKGVGVGLYVGVIHIRQYLKPLRTWNRKIGTGGKARNTSALVGQSRAIGKRS